MLIHVKPKDKDKNICYLCGKKFGRFDNFWHDEDWDYEVGPIQKTDEGIEYNHIIKMWHKQCAYDSVEKHVAEQERKEKNNNKS